MPRALEPITLESLEWATLREALLARLRTPHGRRAGEALAPLGRLAEVRRSLGRIAEMGALLAEQGPLGLGGVEELEPLLERAEKGGRLDGPELRTVLAALRAGMDTCTRLRRAEAAPLLAWLADGFTYLNPLADAIGEAVQPDGELNESAFPELAESRREIADRKDAIHRHLDGLLGARQWAPMLQEPIYSLRGSRYVVPVKADFKAQLPGIVHDVSTSGATLFVEPQAMVEETNALILAEKRYGAQVDAILLRLSARVGEAAGTLRKNLDWIGRIDLIHAQALLARTYEGTAPEVAEEGRIDLRGVAHPLLLLEGGTVVRNDLALGGERQCVVISGANTGGKTVLLKAVGLSLLLVQHGMPVPALAGSRVDRFPRVAADVGDQQTLVGSLSTFSAQIETLAAMLDLAAPGTVLLIDEMLTGTEPRHGSALAAAALRELVARGALCLVTTHYGELKALAGAQPGFVNAAMAFDLERLEPTFRLIADVPGASYAFSIAGRLGLEPAIVKAAQAELEAGGAGADALLEQLTERERLIERREAAMAREAERQSRAGRKLAESERALAEREDTQRRRERRQMGRELVRARREISQILRGLRRDASEEAAERARRRVAELEGDAERILGQPAAAPAEPFDPATARPGDPVFLPGLQRTAEWVAPIPEKRRARLRLGDLLFEAPLDELAPAPAPQPRRKQGPPRPRPAAAAEAPGAGAAPGLILPGEDNVLDLRGLRLDEALERTDTFFDLCVVKHVSPVMVIHGHGTGVLKRGLRERLPDSPYVAAFRPGERREGGDGVTVVALKL